MTAPPIDAPDEALVTENVGPDVAARPRTFYDAPLCTSLDDLDAQVAFLGIPFDLGGRICGTRYAPNAVRDEDGVLLGWTGGDTTVCAGYYDVTAKKQQLDGVSMADCGDVVIVGSDVELNFGRMTRAARAIASRGSMLVAIGGDHAITPPVVRGLDSLGELDVVHFDAHHDFVDHWQGSRWSNKSPLRRVSEFPWVRNVSQVGMRTARTRQAVDDLETRASCVVTTDELRADGPESAISNIPESDAMYVTVDMDVLDPSICPGVSVPEPGGFTYHEMRDALRALAQRAKIVGVDFVELSPPLDSNGLAVKTASRLIIDFLTAIFSG